MEFIIALATKFWQWTVLIAVVIVGAIINFTDKRKKTKLKFNYNELPHLQPLKISTKDKGFWKGIVMWLLSTRNWEITKDWHYTIDGIDYVIPAGFSFDGASIPKFLRTFFSPVGVLLVGGLVHDYAYKYQTLLCKNKKSTMGIISQGIYPTQKMLASCSSSISASTVNGVIAFHIPLSYLYVAKVIESPPKKSGLTI